MSARSQTLFRYLTGQLIVRTLLLLVVLSALIWLIQMLRTFSIVTEKAQGFGVLAYLAFLFLPQIAQSLLFISLTLAAAQILVQMNRSFELHVIHGADLVGTLFGAVLAVSIGFTALSGLLTLYLTPHAYNLQRPVFRQIDADILGRSLSIGGFVEIAQDVTISVELDPENRAKRIFFLHDARGDVAETTYFSTDARLDERNGEQAIILIDGSSQNFDKQAKTMSTSTFAQYRIDLVELTERDLSRARKLKETFTSELVGKVLADDGAGQAEPEISEIALRLSEPLYVFIAPLLAFALLGYPAQSRTRAMPMELIIFVIILVVRGFGLAATGVAATDASKIHLDFVPPGLILLAVIGLALWRRFGHRLPWVWLSRGRST